MRFAFTDEQDMFRDTVRDLFADLCPPAAVRASWDDGGRVPELWSALAEMGVLAALAPADRDGLGMDEVDVIRVLEEAGYAAVPEPLTQHAMVAVPALAEGGSDLLDAALDGRARWTTALSSGGTHVRAAASADALVAEDDGVLVAVPAAEYEVEPESSIDRSRAPGRVRLTGTPVGLPGADASRANDRAALGTAAECIGVARRLLDTTVAYVSERHQFGKPVGSYQAVKHHLADVRLRIEFAAPLVYRAAWSVAHPDTHDAVTRGRDVSMAKAMASDAVDLAARQALQCHGAIGYTFEYDLQLWLTRAWALSAAHGDARWHRDRVADAIGI